ncbi:MAG: PHP domain-containing protein [Chloroflexi bacterium]|nr:PHP domain-containing protein [Chloroflexota bacterium]
MKLKLDLHTHPWEASGFQMPTVEGVRRVLSIIRARGLDGIAITDHHHRDYALEFKAIVDRRFPGQAIILPGWEVEVRPEHDYFNELQLCEIFLDDGSVFTSYCHPGYPGQKLIVLDGMGGIEVRNARHQWHIRADDVRRAAREHSLLEMAVSDAHRLEDIGKLYTEVDLDELYRRARRPGNGGNGLGR